MAAAEGRDRGDVRRPGAVSGGRPDDQHHAASPACWSSTWTCAPTTAAGSRRTGSARKMVDAGLPDFGPVQNNVSFNTRPGRPAASTPSRGTSWSRWPPGGSSAPGSTCGPGTSFGTVVHRRARVRRRRSSCRAGSATPSRPSRTTPPTPTWSTTTGARRPGTPTPSSTWPTRPLAIDWPIPLERAELSEADRNHPRLADVVPMARPQTLIIGAGGQLGRALVGRAARTRPRPTRDRAGPDRPGRGGRVRLRPVRRGDQRRRLHRGRRGRDARGPARRLGHQRDRGGRPGRGGPRAPLHPGAHLLRLRLRRHRRGPPRGRAVHPARGLRPDQGGRRRAGRARCPGTTSCGPAG